MLIKALITILSTTQLCSLPFATGIELDYEELKSINGSCFPMDTCKRVRQPMSSDEVARTTRNSCSCNRLCSKYGTCCIDSIHRKNLLPNPRPECREIKGRFPNLGSYMIDKCSTSGEFDSKWKIPCEADWKDEDSAVLPLAPVTSLLSSITYRNYFCLRCYEKTNDFLYWNIEVMAHYNGSVNLHEEFRKEDYILNYSHRKKTWMAIVGSNRILVPMKMVFEIPSRIQTLDVSCDQNTIFECSELWTDVSVREECNAYQAIIYIGKDDKYLKYRNPHCALCNFQTLEGMECVREEFHQGPSYSFIHTIEVNRFDGDKRVPMNQKCGENIVWDPFSRTCRKLSCSDPRLEISDRKCVPHFNLHVNPENALLL